MPIGTIINIMTKVVIGASIVSGLTYGGLYIYNKGYSDGAIDTVSEAIIEVESRRDATCEPTNG